MAPLCTDNNNLMAYHLPLAASARSEASLMAIAQQLVQQQQHKQWQQTLQNQQQLQPSFCISRELSSAAGNPWPTSTDCTAWPSKAEELTGSSNGCYTAAVYDFHPSSGSPFNESTSVLDLSAAPLLLPPMGSHVQESGFVCKEKPYLYSSGGIDIRCQANTAENCGLSEERFSNAFTTERMEYERSNLDCQIMNSSEMGQAITTVEEIGDRAGFFSSSAGLKQTSLENMSYGSVQTISHADFGFGDVSSEWMDCLMCDLQPEDADDIVACFDTNPCESTQSSEPALAAKGYPCTPDCALPDGFTVLEEAARIECRPGDISSTLTQDTGNEVLSSSAHCEPPSASSSDLISTRSFKRQRITETAYVGHGPLIARNLQSSRNPCLQQRSRDTDLSNDTRTWTAFRTENGTSPCGKASCFGEVGMIRKAEIKTEVEREGQQVPNHGVQLMQLLLECAKTVDSDHEKAASVLPKLRSRSSTRGDPIQRLAAYFTDALSTRFTQGVGIGADGTSPRLHEGDRDRSPEALTLAYKAFNDACPYFTFAQLTANQAILEAIDTAERVHIIDFGISQGTQWAAFLQALATRGGERRVPSRIRITGIASPELGENRADVLGATRRRLEEFGKSLELRVEFQAIEAAMGDEGLEAELMETLEAGEVVAVNFMLELCNLLSGGGGEETAMTEVLRVAERLSPKVVAVAEMDAGLNAASFQKRFVNALHFYSAMFDSLEASMQRECPHRRRMERYFLGEGIQSVVGSGGLNRQRRLQGQDEWSAALQTAGFQAAPLSNYAISQARILLWRFCESFSLSEAEGALALSLGWQKKPLLTVSAWTCRPPASPSASASPPLAISS